MILWGTEYHNNHIFQYFGRDKSLKSGMIRTESLYCQITGYKL